MSPRSGSSQGLPFDPSKYTKPLVGKNTFGSWRCLEEGRIKTVTWIFPFFRKGSSWGWRAWFGYIPILSKWVLVAPPTFEIWPDPGVVTRDFSHELVQELGWRHRRGCLTCGRLLWRCQAGRQERQFGWVKRRSIGLWWQQRDILMGGIDKM